MINCQEIIKVFQLQLDEIAVEEEIEFFIIKFKCKNTGLDSKTIISLFADIPQRDTLHIIFNYADDYLTISSKTVENVIQSYLKKISQYIIGDSDDNFEVSIEIEKTFKNNELSIYSFESFTNWYYELDIISFFKATNFIFHKCDKIPILVCLNDSNFLTTKSICIISNKKMEFNNTYDNVTRENLIKKRDDICHIKGVETNLIPDDFEVIESNCSDTIKLIYNKAKYILSIAYITDECIFEKNKITFSINGYRFKDKSLPFDQITQNTINDNFYLIYSWLYSGGNIHDKSQIVKNIISLHCRYSDITEIDSNVLNTIKSNYNLYIKDNVKDYLYLKKNVTESLQDYCNRISDEINKFTGALKTNMVAILGYLATLLFSKGITKGTAIIFTPDVSILTSFVLLGSIFVCILSAIHTFLKKRYYEALIIGLKQNYTDIMENSEINGIIDNNPLLKIARTNYNIITKIVIIIWVLTIVGLFLVLDYVSGNCKLLFFINLFK